jgi:exosortase A
MLKMMFRTMPVLEKMDYFLLVSILLFGVGFATEWQAYFELWYHSIIYSHGFLVLALSIFMFFRQWPELKTHALTPSIFGFFALIATCLVMLFAKAADIKTITLLALPFVALTWGWALWGLPFLKLCGVPILILVYAAPIWDDFSPVLQVITVFANDFLLSIFEIPAEIEELYITIPSGVFFVAGGCSGVRYLMVALCLGTVYGNLFYRSIRRTILLTLIAGALSMLANWIRVFGIIYAGHVTEMETSLVEDHETFGWIVFVIIALIPIFLIARKLETSDDANATEQVTERTESYGQENAVVPKKSVLASFLIVFAVPAIFYSQTEVFAETDGARLPGLPTAPDNWRGPMRFADFWEPSYQNEDLDLSGIYVSQTLQRIQLQIIGYRTQQQGKELIHHSNRLYDAERWSLISSMILRPDLRTSAIAKVKETVLESRYDKERIIIWSWYYLDGYQSPSVLKTKLIGGVHTLIGDGSGALLAAAARCVPDEKCETQRSDIRSLLSAISFKGYRAERPLP